MKRFLYYSFMLFLGLFIGGGIEASAISSIQGFSFSTFGLFDWIMQVVYILLIVFGSLFIAYKIENE